MVCEYTAALPTYLIPSPVMAKDRTHRSKIFILLLIDILLFILFVIERARFLSTIFVASKDDYWVILIMEVLVAMNSFHAFTISKPRLVLSGAQGVRVSCSSLTTSSFSSLIDSPVRRSFIRVWSRRTYISYHRSCNTAVLINNNIFLKSHHHHCTK